MKQERSEAGGNYRVADPEVPRSPLELEPVELGEVGRSIEHAGILVRRGGRVRHPVQITHSENAGGGGRRGTLECGDKQSCEPKWFLKAGIFFACGGTIAYDPTRWHGTRRVARLTVPHITSSFRFAMAAGSSRLSTDGSRRSSPPWLTKSAPTTLSAFSGNLFQVGSPRRSVVRSLGLDHLLH